MKVFEKDGTIKIRQLNKLQLIELLQAKGDLQEELFRQAREVRKTSGNNDVLLRGVIELSNYCQKNCDYCAMRASNQNIDRYRLEADIILQIAGEIKKANIPIIFFQSGQDPNSDRILEQVIPEIKRRYNLHVLLCLGERSKEKIFKFAQLGANSYILKFETSNREHYREIAHTSLEKRIQCMGWIQEAGLKLGTGNIIGLPKQTLETIAEDILLALEIAPDFVSASPFIANQNTPLEHLPYGNVDLTLNTMAIYRLAFPYSIIPTVSALEKIQPGGQLKGLNAGANVLTINFTPKDLRNKYLIYSDKRFIVSYEHAFNTIAQAGLKVRTLPD